MVKKVVDEKNIQVDLRGKGITGIKSELNPGTLSTVLIFGTVGLFVMAITLTSVVVFHQRRIIKFNRQLSELEIKKLRKQLENNSDGNKD